MILYQQQSAAQNQQQVIDGQIASAKEAEESKRETEQIKIEGDIKKSQVTALAQNQSAVLNMVASLLKPMPEGNIPPIPAELKPLVNAVVDNIMVGAIAASEEQKQQIMTQIEAAREQQMAMQQQMQQQSGGQVVDEQQINQQQPAMA